MTGEGVPQPEIAGEEGKEGSGRIVVGSRKSELARIQATAIGERLTAAWPGLEVIYRTRHTEGDRRLAAPLPSIGGKGLFTAELEAELRSGVVDLVVHSLKDLPTEPISDLDVLAIPARADPLDVIVIRRGLQPCSLDGLPPGARVGTSSLRRRAAMLAWRPDLEVHPIRGNVGTRMGLLDRGDLDAVVLAGAGLDRLGLRDERAVPFSLRHMLPAPGQGALAAQGRTADDRIRRLVGRVEDPPTRAEVTAERSFLASLGGGCQLPIGALGRVTEGELHLHGAVYGAAGQAPAAGERMGPVANAVELGEDLARELIEAGALKRIEAAVDEAGGDGCRS